MASIYRKKTGIYYISVMFQNKRITRSLGTRFYKVAKNLIPQIEKEIYAALLGEKKNQKLSFPELVEKYLICTNHPWVHSTRMRYNYLLRGYLENGLPNQATTRAMTIRVVNACNNWGYKHCLIVKPTRLEGGSKWKLRNRVFSRMELDLLFNQITDEDFNSFVRFAYYTGARSGEIRSLSRENVLDESLVVNGKTGRRIVKLNSQAQKIIQHQDPLWSYSKDFVSHKFKQEVRKLGIKDARFHDLRRTFGLNLIKQGMSIYKVSKLLGHSSVRTTEQHYAPLLTVEIEDFEL
jgi:integrase